MADEIMAEMRRIKEELAGRFGYDLDKLYRYLKQRERESGRQLVNLTKLPKKRGRSRSHA